MNRRDFIINSIVMIGGLPFLEYIKMVLASEKSLNSNVGEKKMKVLLINGSCHKDGTTFTALKEIANTLKKDNIDSEIIQLGPDAQQDCIACGYCREHDKCVFNDIANEIIEKMKTSDALIVGSPVYYAHPSGRVLSVLDRVFYAGGRFLKHKPAASVAVARRAGTTATIDVLNKYFTINQMPVVSSTYWNMVFGANAQDAKEDKEGLQTMRNLAHNMANVLKIIGEAKNMNFEEVIEKGAKTNFVR